MADFRVLMMGGERSGKTSILAGLFDIMSKLPVSDIILTEDVTVPETKNGETQDSLGDKITELKRVLSEHTDRIILVDDTNTRNFWHYTLRVNLKGSDSYLDIVFTDTNGEFYEYGRQRTSEVNSFVEEADIIVVAVDTPSVMQSAERSDKLCTTAVCDGVNRTEGINSFLESVNDLDGHNAKQVIFVPVKCEKWAKEGKLDLVSKRVEEVYESQIKALKDFSKIEIDIIPVQTAGNIVFEEYREAYIAVSPEGKATNCCFLDDDSVRLADGSLLGNTRGWQFRENATKVVAGTDILKPDPWFKVVGNCYTPVNCEQLAFYIFRFVFKKYEEWVRFAKENRGKYFNGHRIPIVAKIIWWPLYLAYRRMMSIYDNAVMKDVEIVLNKLSAHGLILEDTCGIKIIKSIN